MIQLLDAFHWSQLLQPQYYIENGGLWLLLFVVFAETGLFWKEYNRMTIPIIIICYNNYKYVLNTIEQLRRINKEYYKNIQIVNNNSTCVHTIQFLNNLDINVIHNSTNNGPWITNTNNTHIYNSLPDKFILTDPDLQLNPKLPHNFIEILSELSDTYKTEKIGFALDIDDFEKMYKNTNYTHGKSIYEWEIQFWDKKEK